MRRIWLIFSQAVTVAVALLFVVGTLKPEWLQFAGAVRTPGTVSIVTAPDTKPVSLPPGTVVNSYSAAARRATPAVVSVTTSKAAGNPHGNDPWSRFFFGDPDEQQADPRQRQVGLGSGVIVSPEGYLLTNNHVIEGADDIEVQLSDDRKARARLVGADPETDIAVLKIDLDRLPVIAFGDADRIQVGDVVLAIGNPFNVGLTVTSGIVSALGRNRLGITPSTVFRSRLMRPSIRATRGGALVHRSGAAGITPPSIREAADMGTGFAIPVTIAREANGKPGRGTASCSAAGPPSSLATSRPRSPPTSTCRRGPLRRRSPARCRSPCCGRRPAARRRGRPGGRMRRAASTVRSRSTARRRP